MKIEKPTNKIRILFIGELIITVLFTFLLIPSYVSKIWASQFVSPTEKMKGIAVVEAKFDRVENILKRYRIPYANLKYSDLVREDILSRYRTILFPCGIGSSVETNINILSRGTSLQGVSLKDDFIEMDEEKVYNNIKSYINNGGYTYFSGYSYEFIHMAYDVFDFFDNFPNMGKAGHIKIELKNDLKSFCKIKYQTVYIPHSGWIAVKSIKEGHTLANGYFETIRSSKSGPIISILRRGKGEALYTSYHHTSSTDELMRYIIYRVCYRHLLNSLIDEANRWEQEIETTIIDSIREWEECRIYNIIIKRGKNTIYFISDKGTFQIDILDRDRNLIASKDCRKKSFSIDISSDVDSYYTLKVFPSMPRLHGNYSVITAHGIRILPHYKNISFILLFGTTILISVFVKSTIYPRKFSGSIRQK